MFGGAACEYDCAIAAPLILSDRTDMATSIIRFIDLLLLPEDDDRCRPPVRRRWCRDSHPPTTRHDAVQHGSNAQTSVEHSFMQCGTRKRQIAEVPEFTWI